MAEEAKQESAKPKVKATNEKKARVAKAAKPKLSAAERRKGMMPVSGFIPEAIAKRARAYADKHELRMPGLLAEALEFFLAKKA